MAPDEAPAQLVVIGDVFVQVPQREAAASVMIAAQDAARDEDGCIAFAFAERVGERGHFLVVETWRDQGALDAHFRSEAFARYQQDIEPLLVRDSEVRVHRVAQVLTPLPSSGLVIRHDD
jgi:quinol monooxygenase YgiN